MASLDFPSNPIDGQTYSLNGITYVYNAGIGAWLTILSSKLSDTSSNTQVLFNDAGISNGHYGLVFDKTANTLTSNSVVVTNGLYSKNNYLGPYTDGIVIDYVTGTGRISVGTADGITIYANGVANTTLVSISNTGTVLPGSSNTADLGSSTARWRNIYTGDLHLANEFGNWTIVEGEDELFLYNNKKDKVYKFNLTEVDPSSAPPKKGV